MVCAFPFLKRHRCGQTVDVGSRYNATLSDVGGNEGFVPKQTGRGLGADADPTCAVPVRVRICQFTAIVPLRLVQDRPA